MNSRRFLLLLCLFGLCALAEPKREPAPRFHARTTNGEQFDNATTKGKVVLLEFWTTWCPYCRAEQDTIDAVEHDFSDKGLLVLAIDVAESKKQVRKYLEEHPRKTRIVLTEDTNLAAMFAATAYPIYVAIDRDGNVAGERRGAIGRGGLEQLLEKAGLQLNDEAADQAQ